MRCLYFFDLRILISPLVSSNSSCKLTRMITMSCSDNRLIGISMFNTFAEPDSKSTRDYALCAMRRAYTICQFHQKCLWVSNSVYNKNKLNDPPMIFVNTLSSTYLSCIFNVRIPSGIEFVLFTHFVCAYIQTLMGLTKQAEYNGYIMRISHTWDIVV